jgi:hypothetical protein
MLMLRLKEPITRTIMISTDMMLCGTRNSETNQLQGRLR